MRRRALAAQSALCFILGVFAASFFLSRDQGSGQQDLAVSDAHARLLSLYKPTPQAYQVRSPTIRSCDSIN
jgi:hypothetical protein